MKQAASYATSDSLQPTLATRFGKRPLTRFDVAWWMSIMRLLEGRALSRCFPVATCRHPARKASLSPFLWLTAASTVANSTSASFVRAANRLRAELLRTAAMTAEQELYYRLNAFLDDEQPVRPANKLAISLDPPTQNISMASGCRREFGPAEAWDEPDYSDLPVLVDQCVLEEAVQEAQENPDDEIAGFLLGQLTRDEETKEVFVAVTGLATANPTTEATSASVTYTPASFAQVRNIIKLRATGEIGGGVVSQSPVQIVCRMPTADAP